MDILIYIGIALAVGLVVFCGGYLLVKYPKLKEALANSKLIIQLINKLNEAYDWRWSGPLDTICDYTLMAIEIVEETQDEKDLYKLREIIFEKAITICEINNIEVNEELVDLIGKIIDEAIKMKQEGAI